MSIPNAGDFEVVYDIHDEWWLVCPTCDPHNRDNWTYVWADTGNGNGPTVRNLIGAASEHARTAHRTSVPA